MRLRLGVFSLASLGSLAGIVACGESGTGGGGGGGSGGAEDGASVAEACAPFADAAGWHRGEPSVGAAESTSERMRAVGDETWLLALELLEAVPVNELANVANSPTSVYASLGMAYSRWQDGQCGERIAEVLRFPETGDDIHPTLGATLAELRGRSLPEGEDGPPVTVLLEQSSWAVGESSPPPQGEIASIYGATPYAVEDKGEATRQLVNCVIEQQSTGLLKDFLPSGSIRADTASLDINVTVLKAPWDVSLSQARVRFTPEGGEEQEVDGSSASVLSARYWEGPHFDAIHLPLRGRELFVMMVVPNETVTSSLADFTASLDVEELRAARDSQEFASFEFSMPQIDVAPRTIDFYGRLGFECDEFTLRSVFHGAAVVMDEKGIEAAAATVSEGWSDGGEPEADRVFAIERPFLFFAYDVATGFVLFSGRVLDPTSEE